MRSCCWWSYINITISGIVSDNAANLKSALTNNDPHDPNFIKAMIGESYLRIACAAHTSQLCIRDYINQVIEVIQRFALSQYQDYEEAMELFTNARLAKDLETFEAMKTLVLIVKGNFLLCILIYGWEYYLVARYNCCQIYFQFLE